jgi:hypothetical protein
VTEREYRKLGRELLGDRCSHVFPPGHAHAVPPQDTITLHRQRPDCQRVLNSRGATRETIQYLSSLTMGHARHGPGCEPLGRSTQRKTERCEPGSGHLGQSEQARHPGGLRRQTANDWDDLLGNDGGRVRAEGDKLGYDRRLADPEAIS